MVDFFSNRPTRPEKYLTNNDASISDAHLRTTWTARKELSAAAKHMIRKMGKEDDGVQFLKYVLLTKSMQNATAECAAEH